MPVEVTADTTINGQPTLGGTAKLVVIRTANDQLQALQITVVIAIKINTTTPSTPDDGSPGNGGNRTIEQENTPQTVKTSSPGTEKVQPTANGGDNHSEPRIPEDNSSSPQHLSTPEPQSGDEEQPRHSTPSPQFGEGGQLPATATRPSGDGEGQHHGTPPPHNMVMAGSIIPP